MAGSLVLVICLEEVENAEEFARFVKSEVEKAGIAPEEIVAASDPETMFFLDAFSQIFGLVGKVDFYVDKRHSKENHRSVSRLNQRYEFLSSDFPDEDESQCCSRIFQYLSTSLDLARLALITKDVWNTVCDNPSQNSAILNLRGGEANEIASMEAFREFSGAAKREKELAPPRLGKASSSETTKGAAEALEERKSEQTPPEIAPPQPARPIPSDRFLSSLLSDILSLIDSSFSTLSSHPASSIQSSLKEQLTSVFSDVHEAYQDHIHELEESWSRTASESVRMYVLKTEEVSQAISEAAAKQDTIALTVKEVAELVDTHSDLSLRDRVRAAENEIRTLKDFSEQIYEQLPPIGEKQKAVAITDITTNAEGELFLTLSSRKVYDITGLDLCICSKDNIELGRSEGNAVKGGEQIVVELPSIPMEFYPLIVYLEQRGKIVSEKVALAGGEMSKDISIVRKKLHD